MIVRSPGSFVAPGLICVRRFNWSEESHADVTLGRSLSILNKLCFPLPHLLVAQNSNAPKCNEALSRDLWPLDPFESAPMRATSSVLYNCICYAILEILKLKDLYFIHTGERR